MVGRLVVAAAVLALGCSGGDDDDTGSGGAGGSSGNGMAATGGGGAGGTAGLGGTSAAGAGRGGSAGAQAGAGAGGQAAAPCQPMSEAVDKNPAAVKLVENIFGGALASVGDDIVYGSSNGLNRVPKAGGDPVSILSGSNVSRFVVSGKKAYFDADGDLSSVDVTEMDATAEVVASGVLPESNDILLDADATHVYLWTPAMLTVKRIAVADGAVNDVATGVAGTGWSLFDDYFYYIDDTTEFIRRSPVAGGTSELVSNRTPTITWTVGVDATHLFVGGYGELDLIADTTRTTLLTLSMKYFDTLVPDGDRVLYAADGTVGWVMVDGSSCRAAINDTFLYGWAYDDENFYFSSKMAIYKVPK